MQYVLHRGLSVQVKKGRRSLMILQVGILVAPRPWGREGQIYWTSDILFLKWSDASTASQWPSVRIADFCVVTMRKPAFSEG
jgi:hypothetical protein